MSLEKTYSPKQQVLSQNLSHSLHWFCRYLLYEGISAAIYEKIVLPISCSIQTETRKLCGLTVFQVLILSVY